MPFRSISFRAGPELLRFVAQSDYLIANLEGVITHGTHRRVFLGQRHDHRVITFLASLKDPARVLLSCANNHAADYGAAELRHSCSYLDSNGFRWFGTVGKPSITIADDIAVTATTSWSNHPAPFLNQLDPLAIAADPKAKFNVLFPHWGFEMRLYPDATQTRVAHRLLESWDMIMGHHSHSPQPVDVVQARSRIKPVAYSLGNAAFGRRIDKYLRGRAVRVTVGPNAEGNWCVGALNWRNLEIDPEDALIDLVPVQPVPSP